MRAFIVVHFILSLIAVLTSAFILATQRFPRTIVERFDIRIFLINIQLLLLVWAGILLF